MEHEHAASLTARAVKKALPERAILTRDARQTLNSAASMFTLYLASKAQKHVTNGEAATTSEVTEQLDEVTIDTNEEDADDDGMQSVEEPSEMEEGDNEEVITHEEPTVDDTMQEEDTQPKGSETNAEQTDDEQVTRKKTAEGEHIGEKVTERPSADSEEVDEVETGDSADAMEVTPS
ncbi:hypothetical protein BBJ28_00007193 [Nothophytophthora sp. Chile5]|nr:hypothetical protein BBJ28_00007193 [Nothophytophthora sp. Chile5]